MPLLFAPNLSMLWPDQPFAERFGRAARAGFRAVELWWPGEAAAERLTPARALAGSGPAGPRVGRAQARHPLLTSG